MLIKIEERAELFKVEQRRHRGRKGPFNTFNTFFTKGFYRLKLVRELKFYAWIIIEGSESLKKRQKTLKKATDLV